MRLYSDWRLCMTGFLEWLRQDREYLMRVPVLGEPLVKREECEVRSVPWASRWDGMYLVNKSSMEVSELQASIATTRRASMYLVTAGHLVEDLSMMNGLGVDEAVSRACERGEDVITLMLRRLSDTDDELSKQFWKNRDILTWTSLSLIPPDVRDWYSESPKEGELGVIAGWLHYMSPWLLGPEAEASRKGEDLVKPATGADQLRSLQCLLLAAFPPIGRITALSGREFSQWIATELMDPPATQSPPRRWTREWYLEARENLESRLGHLRVPRSRVEEACDLLKRLSLRWFPWLRVSE